MDEQQVRKIIKDELSGLLGSDRYVFQRLLQLADGRNIQVGLTTGTKIGTATTQKLGFFNKTPIVQPSAISAPTNPSATYVQAEAQSMKTAVDAIRTALINLGLTG